MSESPVSPPVQRAALSDVNDRFPPEHDDSFGDGSGSARSVMMDPSAEPDGPAGRRANVDSVEAPRPAMEPEGESTGHRLALANEHGSDLSSRDPEVRRRALDAIVAGGLSEANAPAVARMLQDPDRRIRVAALEALATLPDSVDPSLAHQALRDPSDEVRAAAVRLAAASPSRDAPDLFRIVAERQWPAAQEAALHSLPRAVASFGIGPEELTALLEAVASMESEPGPAEHDGLGALARAIGRGRLEPELSPDSAGRLGVARLLLAEGSISSLREVAEVAEDADPDIGRLGRRAAERLAPELAEDVAEEPEEGDEEIPDQRGAQRLGPRDELFRGLAQALEDPEEAVRRRAGDALRGVDRPTLIEWTLRTLASPDGGQVLHAVQVTEAVRLTEAAPVLLTRGASETPDVRSAFARALASLSLTSEELVAATAELDGRVRADAVRMLWQVEGRAILPALRPLLEDASAPVRVAALEVFGHSGDPQTIEVAQHVLERDSSPVVRATAISVIGRAGLDQRSASLAKALADPDPDVRATAVEVLPAGMGRYAADLLFDALSDQDERVWQAAIRHLASVPDRDRSIVWRAIERCPATRREHLVAALERSSVERLALLALDHLSSPDPGERTLAIALAGRAGTPDCVRGIVTALQDPAPTVRLTAASALHSLHTAESIEGLAHALSDPDVEVRVEAVRALSEIDDDSVLDPLITALKDPEMRVRDVAADALVRWRSPSVARRLAIALTNPSLRRPAGEVLGRMGSSAVDPLVEILMEDDPELAATVGTLLDTLVGADAFLMRLGSMDAAERMRAVEALGAMGGERGLEGLIRALSDPVESIRVRAVTLLGEIESDRAFEAVKQTFLSDPVQEVVTAAEEALRRIQGGTEPPPEI